MCLRLVVRLESRAAAAGRARSEVLRIAVPVIAGMCGVVPAASCRLHTLIDSRAAVMSRSGELDSKVIGPPRGSQFHPECSRQTKAQIRLEFVTMELARAARASGSGGPCRLPL